MMPVSPVRTLIVDDEPLGRERIEHLLRAHPAITIVGQCTHGREAVHAIRTLQPHLVFLDVQMPELDGFGVIREVGVTAMPPVIFVTAYDAHALEAFEVHALDYLLKPFDSTRFNTAVQRALQLIATPATSAASLTAMLEHMAQPPAYMERILIKTRSRIFLVQSHEIDWIEAAGNYVQLHVGPKTHLIRHTMSQMEKRLSPDLFMRIHRSTIVNLNRIKELRPHLHGEYLVMLDTGDTLTLSRGYRDQLTPFFLQ